MSYQFELQKGSETWFSLGAAAAQLWIVLDSSSGFSRRNSGTAERDGLGVTQLLYHTKKLV